MSYDEVDRFFKKPFKFKHRGMTLTARPMAENEVITEKTLQYQPLTPGQAFTPHVQWTGSRCVGEPCSLHPQRWYIEVLSPFFSGESTADYTGL